MRKNQYFSCFFIVGVIAVLNSFAIHAQIITTIAGNGIRGYAGDGGPATAASTANPGYVALDPLGNVYFFDGNNRIRKINNAGILNAFAGTGCGFPCIGYSGDGGPASAAQLTVNGLFIDGTGTIYFTDQSQHIRKINTAGIISTIAGTGTAGYNGDGIAATAADLNYPSQIVMDGIGNLFFSDAYNQRVRKIDVAGIITTVAGNGIQGYTGDGMQATATELCFPGGLAFDGYGNLYFSDSARVRKVNTAGIITTFAGTGVRGYTGDGGPSTAAELYDPGQIAIDATGNVYFPDRYYHRIRKVNVAGIISTIAGTGGVGFSGDGLPATMATFATITDIKQDCGGNIYLADDEDQRVRMITYNHAPVFTHGHTQSFSICEGAGGKVMDTMLAVFDIDTLQNETWSVLTAPIHGSVVAAYSTASDGDTLIPTGTSYTPAPGYSGNDTFTIVVTDCGHLSDTTTVYVTVIPPPDAGNITGIDSVCIGGSPATLHNAVTGVWSASNSKATVAGGIVTGVTTGVDTIIYTATNACGVATKIFPMRIVACPAGVTTSNNNRDQLSILPNPNNGLFTFTLSSATDEEVQVVITDMAGRIVKEVTTVTNKATDIQLNMPAGVYFLSAVTAKGMYMAKVVVGAQ